MDLMIFWIIFSLAGLFYCGYRLRADMANGKGVVVALIMTPMIALLYGYALFDKSSDLIGTPIKSIQTGDYRYLLLTERFGENKEDSVVVLVDVDGRVSLYELPRKLFSSSPPVYSDGGIIEVVEKDGQIFIKQNP